MDDNFVPRFELIADIKLNDFIPVKKYKSAHTGLTVVLGDIEGPIVSGKFFVVTEASDNNGLPHTLEHMISLGSEDYPYKGVLDLVANRCLASGTNAWTGDDHTCYTIDCVGAEGFLRTLPVYMDHILYPLLTDTAFVTEVHHITEDGKDGGVVYCEMQGRENTGEERINLELMKGLYPGTGYAVHCGGLMKSLIESTTNEKIKQFHKKFYRPENLTLIIGGQVDPSDVFDALIPIEKKILSKGQLPPFERPWQTPLEPISESKTVTINYPDDEEKNGIVMIGYRGPVANLDLFDEASCEILLKYLSDTATSPLMRDMVEIDDPYASGVCCCIIADYECLLRCCFQNVPLHKIDEVYKKYFNVLKKISDGQEPIDMKRMKEVIDKRIVENLKILETDPHSMLANEVIVHVVYGDDDNFYDSLNSNKIFSKLRDNEESFWIDVLNKYIIDAKYMCVKAVPSIEEKERLAKEDQERIERRKQDLGPAGLLEMGNILKEATEANNVHPPESMITNISIPGFENIGTHPVKIYRLTDEHDLTELNLKEFPVYTEAIDINSNFVHVVVTINTENIPKNLRLYLGLFLQLLAKCPIMRNGEMIPFDSVVNQIEADTIYSSYDIGNDDSDFFCVEYSNTLFITMNVEPKKYHLVAKWLEEILNHTIFDKDRVSVTAKRLFNTVAEIKRNGYRIVMAMVQAMFYKSTSNVRLLSVLKQEEFLKNLLKRLDDVTEAQDVIDDFNSLKQMLMQNTNISLHIATNWRKMLSNEIDLAKPFQMLVESKDEIKELGVVSDCEHINPGGNLDEETHGLILGLGAVESTYLYSAVSAIANHLDPDLPALMLFGQYFTQVEGPFYREIRGKGYSYGYDIEMTPVGGLLSFSLYLSTNLSAAYKAAKVLIKNQLEEDAVWDPNLLQSARTSLMCKIVEREENLQDVIKQAVLSSFKKVPVGYNQMLIKQVNEVTKEDLARVGEKYMKLLFGTEARTAIVCNPKIMKEMQAEFEGLGYSFKIETSLENSILA